MRVAALVAGMVGMSACYDDSFGSILEASGSIEFDHVEVFFGHEVGSRTPLTPRRLQAMVRPPAESQLLLERRLAADDALVATTNPRETAWNYFIPFNEQNKELGRYALIVVSKNGQEVGAAELFDFEVPGDALHRYRIPIEPLASEDYERWGNENDCIRWTRERTNKLATIAIVPTATNPDCDAFGVEDCDDMQHCDPSLGDSRESGCYAPDACLITNSSTSACGAGDCVNKAVGVEPPCEPATCIDERLCAACKSEDPQVLSVCSTTIGGGGHPDLSVPLMGAVGARTLCSKPDYDLDITLPFPCLEPDIEAITYYYQDPAVTGPQFFFRLIGSSTNVCRLHITEPFANAPWIGSPHFIFSVRHSSSGSFARTRIAFGVYDFGLGCGEIPPPIDPPILQGCGS